MDIDELKTRCAAGETFRYLFFWGHAEARAGEVSAACLSQWYPAEFTIAKQRYPTAEHWMMASKARLFGDEEMRAKILAAPDPSKAKALGRKVRDFDERVWTSMRRQLVREGNIAKFKQNPPLEKFLLATAGQVLVEAAPNDGIWGIGLAATDPLAKDPATWRGFNLLGFALMDARDEIAAIREGR